MKCANCGEDLFDGDVFCTECGSPVADAASVARPGGETEDGPDPVGSFDADDETDNDVTVRRPSRRFSEPSNAAPPDPGFATAQAVEVCPACGEELEAGAPFCLECGEPRPETEQQTPAAVTADPADTTPSPRDEAASVHAEVCVACGAGLESGAAFCTECGHRTDQPAPPPRDEAPSASPDVAESASPDHEASPGEAIGDSQEESQPQDDSAAIARCPSCGAQLEDGAAYCTECGARMPAAPALGDQLADASPPPATDATAAGTCASCGAVLAGTATFCTACGQRVVTDSNRTVVLTPVGSSEPDAQEDLTTAAPTDRCPSCGASLVAGSRFCTGCGARVDQVAGDGSAPAASVCISCSAAIPEGSQFCVTCGARQTTDTPPPATGTAPCRICGEPVTSDSSFCINCGAPTEATAEPAALVTELDRAPQLQSTEVSTGSAPPHNPADALAAFCIVCGNRLEPGDEFCIKCGLPRDGSPEPTAVSETVVAPVRPTAEPAPVDGHKEEKRKRSLLPLWIALIVVVLGAGAWFAWTMLSGDDGSSETNPGVETTVAVNAGADQSETTEAAGVVATGPGQSGGATCPDAADAAVDATVGLMDAFSTSSLGDLVAAALNRTAVHAGCCGIRRSQRGCDSRCRGGGMCLLRPGGAVCDRAGANCRFAGHPRSDCAFCRD